MSFPGSSIQIWKLPTPNRWFLFAVLLVVAAVVSYVFFTGRDSGDDDVEGCYTSIFSFGDSLTDTGNLEFVSPSQSPNCLLPPYGETHFHQPNGRCSDGRLILDFIAESLGLPYMKPYLGFNSGALTRDNIKHGVNFAVAGSTALTRGFFEENGFAVQVTTNYSLRVQLDWFKDVLRSLCSSPSSCRKVLSRSLFIVGEIGGNDYSYPLFDMEKLELLKAYTTQVICVITSAVKELIDLGAVTVMVPGSLPLGCNPAYLTMYATANKEAYDKSGCLKWLNDFFQVHNQLLRIQLHRLRLMYPRTNIIYADYFNAALQFYRSPQQFGFSQTLRACCGGGGAYNYNNTAMCGDEGVIACDDPSQHVSWDAYHLTESAYRWITKALLNGPYTFPKLSVSCISRDTSAHSYTFSM